MFTVSSTPLYVRNTYNPIRKRKPDRKIDKNMNRGFTEEEIHMAINICRDVHPL